MVRVFTGGCAALLVAAGVSAADRAPPVSPLFDRVAAMPGERVTVKAPNFSARRPLRVYLVPRGEARSVRSRFDRRLHFVGVIPKRGRARFTFTVPPLSSGSYAAWCAGCRSRAALQVTMPPATAETCPATTASGPRPPGLEREPRWHGNGFLWTYVPPDGTWNVDPRLVQPDGTIFNKQIWLARPMFGKLTVRLERLDTPAPIVSVETVEGRLSGYDGPSWAARMRFPTPGCWLVSGRVADITLSYVLRVVLASPKRNITPRSGRPGSTRRSRG